MWSLASGDCLLEDGCLSSPNFPRYVYYASSCEVAINPEWTGVLRVEYGTSWENSFFIDGEEIPLDVDLHNLDGMEPKSTLVWSGFGSSHAWKMCQAEAVAPWRVTTGPCRIDRAGCFESAYFVKLTVGIHPSCWQEDCAVEILDEWEGVSDVVDVFFQDDSDAYDHYFGCDQCSAVLEVNDKAFLVSSKDAVVEAGVQGMVASEFRWKFTTIYYGACGGLKICPMASPNLPGPWGDNPWTCTVGGDDCTLPFVLDGVTFSTCTQQFSDPYDADGDGSQHNGHPQCLSETVVTLCGPWHEEPRPTT